MENNCCKNCNTVYKQVAVVLDDGAYMPEYAHFGWDAGADLKSPVDVMIPANGSAVIDTGVHIDIPKGYAGFLKSKSGLNVKHDLTSEGVIDAGYGKRNPTTILKFPREKGLHPTQKPVKLEEWLIKTYTNPGETVLDNCMGSGTTGVACINTNRDFIGIEKNPDYYKAAISRIKEAQDNGKQGNQKKQPDHD